MLHRVLLINERPQHVVVHPLIGHEVIDSRSPQPQRRIVAAPPHNLRTLVDVQIRARRDHLIVDVVDGIYGEEFSDRVESLDIDEVKTAVRSPWQNPYAERVIGSIRRECLDHMIILNERHLYRVLAEYLEYYNAHRAHQGLDGDAPLGRNKEPPDFGPVEAIPFLGGLHHRYTRKVA